VRRRVVELLEKGMAIRVGREGFIVPAAALSRPEVIQGLKRSHLSLTRFLKELKTIGVEAA
jgi:hypothetical protein